MQKPVVSDNSISLETTTVTVGSSVPTRGGTGTTTSTKVGSRLTLGSGRVTGGTWTT